MKTVTIKDAPVSFTTPSDLEGPSIERLEMMTYVARSEVAGGPRGTVPSTLIGRYVRLAKARAMFERLEDGNIYASVVGIQGVWGVGSDESSALKDLAGALEGWLELKISDGDGDIPVLSGINLNKITSAAQ